MFNLDQFVSDRAPTWTELEQLVDRRGQLVRAGSAPTVCAASASATARPRPTSRSRAVAFPGDPVVARLERLVQRGRQGVYNTTPTRGDRCASSSSNGYWRRVRERPALLAISFLCLVVPTLLGGLLGVARSRARERSRAERSTSR